MTAEKKPPRYRGPLGRPAAGPVKVTKADGTVKYEPAREPAPGARPNTKRAFGTHSAAYRNAVNRRRGGKER